MVKKESLSLTGVHHAAVKVKASRFQNWNLFFFQN